MDILRRRGHRAQGGQLLALLRQRLHDPDALGHRMDDQRQRRRVAHKQFAEIAGRQTQQATRPRRAHRRDVGRTHEQRDLAGEAAGAAVGQPRFVGPDPLGEARLALDDDP